MFSYGGHVTVACGVLDPCRVEPDTRHGMLCPRLPPAGTGQRCQSALWLGGGVFMGWANAVLLLERSIIVSPPGGHQYLPDTVGKKPLPPS